MESAPVPSKRPALGDSVALNCLRADTGRDMHLETTHNTESTWAAAQCKENTEYISAKVQA